MAKMKMSVLLVGAALLVLITIVSTYLVLLLTNVIPSDPIKVEILINDVEKVYDGTPLKADSYTFGEGSKLLKGHTLELEYIGSLTDAGSIKSSATAHVYDGDHTDKTNDYSFKIVNGNITVNKKHIAISVKNEELDYGDGTNLDDKVKYEITNGGLCSGHKIVPDYTFVEGTTSVATTMTAEIFDANGVNVTKNYEVEYRSANLPINKTKLTFKTESKEKTYDGDAFSDRDFATSLVYGTLPEGYTYDVLYNYTGKGNVGSTELVISTIVIYDNMGDDVTSRFDITTQNTGILTINPIEVDVAVSNKEFTYDGQEHSWSDFEVRGDAKITVDQSDTTRFTYNNYSYGVTAVSSTKAVDAGSIINIVNFRIVDSYGEDVTNNFRINQTSAILTINKKPLIIYADSKTWDYEEDTPRTITEKTPAKSQGLITGHKITVEYSSASQLRNAGTVKNEIYSYEVLDGDKDVTSNYNVTTVDGTLTINKKKVTFNPVYTDDGVTSISAYYTTYGYDITSMLTTDSNPGDFKFVSDDIDIIISDITLNYDSLLHAGNYEILPAEYKIKSGNTVLTAEALKNYDITFNPVKFQIKRTPVFIVVDSTSVEINNSPYIDFICTIFNDIGDFEQDFDIVVDDFDYTTVGTYNVGITLEQANIEASLDDYILTVTPGIITVYDPANP